MRRYTAIGVVAVLVASTAGPAVAGHCESYETLAAEIASLRDSDPETGIRRGQAALSELDDSHECLIADALLRGAIGSNLMVLGRNGDAAAEYDRALAQLTPGSDPRHRSMLHRGAGLAQANQENFEAAITHYLEALSASEAAGDTLESAKTAGNVGNLYNTLGRLDESQRFLERALAGFRETGWREGIAGSLINLGALAAKRAASATGDAARTHNEALLEHNRQALELFTELGNMRGVAYAASNVGLAHDRFGHPAEALPYHRRALEARRAVGDRDGTINSLVSIASSSVALERYARAEEALEEALELAPADHPTLRLTVIEPWIALEEARGDHRAAFERLRQAVDLRNRMAADDLQARVAEIQSRFESERQEREIADLRHQRELTDLELVRSRHITLAAAVIASLSLALGAALYARYRLKVRAQAALEQAARTDELTGLANRRDIRERVEYEIQRTRRTARPFSVGIIDIDRFKEINDTFGHSVGDSVLVALGDRLQAKLRRQDTLARWGGDELLLLLPETDEAGAIALGEKLVGSLATDGVVVAGRTMPVEFTMGVAQYWPGMTIDECLQCADDALYRGKHGGRNQVRAKRP